MGVRIRFIKASEGDCILVTHVNAEGVYNVLIDGGPPKTFKSGPQGRNKGPLLSILDQLKEKEQQIDLAIVTHIDSDHIGGILSAFKSKDHLREMVKCIWFNSSEMITNNFHKPVIQENEVVLGYTSASTSTRQARTLESLLKELNCKWDPLILAGETIKKGPFTLKILSPSTANLEKLLCVWPDERSSPNTSSSSTDHGFSFEDLWLSDKFIPDKSISNGSSIAFILEADSKSMLFLGDAHDRTVINSLLGFGYKKDNKLSAEFIKVSHHGSQYNTSKDFLDLVDTKKFVITTDGSKHGLPNKRTIARILKSSKGSVYFNYKEVIGNLLLDHETALYSKHLVELTGEIDL
jgi:beta-lactamase superfamily II metal-dependent hydrolase